MKNLTKLVMLGLLMVPFAAIINMGNAFGATVNVSMQAGSGNAGENKGFDPKEVHVAVGTTVVWTNDDAAGHTVTSAHPGDTDAGALFDSTKDPSGFLVKPRATWQHTFDKAGEFPYFCQVHPWMLGEVYVGGATEEQPEKKVPTPAMPMMVIPTDNGSIKVEVTVDKGMIAGSKVTIDTPQEVKFGIRFLDPTTGQPIKHVNYSFMVADQGGNMVVRKEGLHVHEGVDSQSVAFSNTGSFTLTINVPGTGINKPFDTTHSGTASSMITVVPEFPLSVMAIMAAVVGIGVAATRFKNPLKL